MYSDCIKLLVSAILLIVPTRNCNGFCFNVKKTLPTSFPYITLPPGATFPTAPTTTGTTATTGFVFSTGTPTLFTFPTVVTAPTTLPTFPTLPTQQTFPTLPPQTFPTVPTPPLTTAQCPVGLSLCPPAANGAPVAPGGFGFLPNGCPCFDPRMGQALGQRCYTREYVQGFCINEQNCAYVNDGIPRGEFTRVLTLGGFFRRTICGYDGIDVMVCCPYQPGAGVFDQIFQSAQFTFDPLSPITSSTVALNFPTSTGNTQPTPVTTNVDNVCGISNFTQTRVVGGNNAKLNQYPWIAALGYVQPGSVEVRFFCAGSLISQRHVLSTAHCVNDNLQLARLGEYDLNSNADGANPIDIPIGEKIVHEQYVANLILNDIAMLVLRQQVAISDQIRPICLPINEPLRSKDITGYQPFLAGWGTTSYQGSPSSILQEVQIPIVSTSDCESNYRAFFPNQVFDNRIICAGYGGKDACQGDSGGPLMLPQAGAASTYYELIGLVSYGYECAREGFPGIYTRVTTFIPWIESKMYQDFI